MVSLFDQLDQYDTPADPQAETKPDYLLTIKKTKGGHDIMICTADPIPQAAIDEAAAAGLPLFSPSEIAKLSGADSATVESTIAAKLAIPGSSVESCTLEPSE